MFTVGEFSKIAQVSGRLLRYYDEIGLLKPEHIDRETSYRYYSAKQLVELNRILALKELGLSLEQIARLLKERISTEDILEMLNLRKAQITHTLATEMARLQYVEARIQQVQEKGQMKDYEVVLKAVPDQLFLAHRQLLPNMEAAWQLVDEIHRAVPGYLKPKSLGYFSVITHTNLFDTENMDVEMGFLVNNRVDLQISLSRQRHLAVRPLQGSEFMLTAVRVGEFENGYIGYNALGIWMETNDYRFAGPGRELFIQPTPSEDSKPTENVVEIQIPVKKADPTKYS